MPLLNCADCGREVSDKAGSCPNCGCPTRPSTAPVKSPQLTPGHGAQSPPRASTIRPRWWAWIVVGLVTWGLYGLCARNEKGSDTSRSSEGRGTNPGSNMGSSLAYKLLGQSATADAPSKAPPPHDDLSLFEAKYGQPDIDDSTQYDDPRPPMVTRWVIYKAEHVQATYLADAPVGSPPPYENWKLVGFQDSQNKNKILDPAQVARKLARRLRQPAP